MKAMGLAVGAENTWNAGKILRLPTESILRKSVRRRSLRLRRLRLQPHLWQLAVWNT